ncbi:MAG: hypothetical protein Q9215_000066 [Flavoplaca cf. flavocitrina]
MDNSTVKRSASRNRPPSRPTTPLRPSSRTSLRESQTFTPGGGASSAFPLDALEPAFAEFSDSMADLEANLMHLQLMHESLSRFNENFASFLYGLNMNAFCVDFPEAPIPESFKRARPIDDAAPTPEEIYGGRADSDAAVEQDPEASFLYFIFRQACISQEALEKYKLCFRDRTANLWNDQQARNERIRHERRSR